MNTKRNAAVAGAIGRWMGRNAILLAFLALCVVLSVSSPSFLTPANILNVLRQISINAIIAVGMTLVIITGGIDLSVGSIAALSAVVACRLAHPGEWPWVMPVIAGLMAGMMCGVVNGCLIAYGRIAPFVVTLGMMTSLRGLALVTTEGRPVINLSDAYNWIGGGVVAGLPVPVLIALGVALAGTVVLRFTLFGRHVYAVGGNERAAIVAGLRPALIKVWVYGLMGLAAGLAGIVISSRVMTGSPVAGLGYELDAIAAVVIGGTSLAGGVGGVGGTLVGALIIGVMNNGLDLLNVSSYYQQIIKGAIIVCAVLADSRWRSRKWG